MKKKFVENCCTFIGKYINCDELKVKKLKYGLEALYNLLTKVIVIFFLSIFFDLWKEYLLLLLIYAITKKNTYGIHAKTSLACWFTTLPIYLFGAYFVKVYHLPGWVILSIWIFGFISFLLWAPADTPNMPLIHSERRRKQKIKACLTCILFLVIIYFFSNQQLENAICYSLVVQSICINPLTYKLTKTPFDNYKLYYKNHGLNC